MKIHAVRGPLTRARLLALGLDCPEVYGDPAILLPRYHRVMDLPKKHEIGLVAHYTDLEWCENLDGVHVINVMRPVEQVIEDICSCKLIASSSLHGCLQTLTAVGRCEVCGPSEWAMP